MEDWEIIATTEFRDWSETLDKSSLSQLVQAIDRLAEIGPTWEDRSSTGSRARGSTT